MVLKDSVQDQESTSGITIMPDIKPYQSMITGEEITSRSKHVQHLRQHNMIEVGNDSSLHKPYQGLPDVNPRQRKEILRREVNKFTHSEWVKAGKKHREAVMRYMEKNGKD
jgi:hypothetical protein